ncbi:MAG: PSD1 and planctomycete cytochrome C domain-containing protein [Planctomycetota bacterium]
MLMVVILPASGDEPAPAAASFSAEDLEFFEKEVRPILVARCYECHSRDAKKVQGGFLVDSRAGALNGGDTGAAVVPGKPKESLLIDSINYGETYQMPPKSKMPATEIATLTRWVERGAPWPQEKPSTAPTGKDFNLAQRLQNHWCWQPIQRPVAPTVKKADWPAKPLDRFLLAKLEAAGLEPASAADRATWLRRVYFDLLGLPPTPAEIAAFLSDSSPEAFEKRVDELLKSPQFGERWGRHWLDLVRYAETYGHEFDFPIPHASQYRDYVIRAFNADVPYNQLVLEHLAGDLLTAPRLHPTEKYNESVIGTGFWFLGEATHAPVDVRGDEMGRIDNQVDVMSKTFLGITLACARCHDHKFDAISTRDYYTITGALKSSRRQEALLDPQGRIAEQTTKLKQIAEQGSQAVKQLLPQKTATTAADVARYLLAARAAKGATPEQIAGIAQQQQVDATQLQRWLAALNDPTVKQPTHALEPWLALANLPSEPQANEISGQRQRIENAARQAAAARDKAPLFADFSQDFAATGWFTTGEAYGRGPTRAGQWDSQARVAEMVRQGVASSGQWSPKSQGVLRSPTFTLSHRHIHYKLKGANVQIRLVIDGYFMDAYTGLLFGGCIMNVDKSDTYSWRTQGGDVGRYLGHRAHIEIIDHGDGFVAIDEIRFSDEGAPPDVDNPLALAVLAAESNKTLADVANQYGHVLATALERGVNGTVDAATVELLNWLLRHGLLRDDAAAKPHQEALAAVVQQLDQLAPQLPQPMKVLAITDGSGWEDKVHIRGNYRTLGEAVPRRSLEAFQGRPVTGVNGSGRLALAQEWIDPANPLVSRVLVNRVWQHLFGAGIVPSVDNFGVLGQEPTHPELLDHLATEFVNEGWSIKRLIRNLVLSSTYRMSSVASARSLEVDPTNKLLQHQRIRRLEGEAIRDALLKIAGRIDLNPAGGSVPVHLTAFMQGRGRPGGSGPLDGQGRRSIYQEVRRNFLPPMMLAFDTPIPFSTVGGRNSSNVPAQALILMNDPFVIEQTQRWAKRVLELPNLSDEQRIDQMYLEALARKPTDAERAAAFEFFELQAAEYRLPAEQARRDVRVWADLGHVLVNVKEFIYLN